MKTLGARLDHRSLGKLRAVACRCAVAAAIGLATPALASPAPSITVAAPEGFEDLTSEQTLLVDVYFGGSRRGEAMIVATPGMVKIIKPSELVAMLPKISDPAAVTSALAERLPAHSERACSVGADAPTCGRLSPEVVGVILDRDRLRVDVFLNPRFLQVQDNLERQYLPAPADGFAMINGITALLSGSSGPGGNVYNLQDQLIVGHGERRLRADLSYASGLGFEAERVAFEWDWPEMRLSAGTLWAPGNELTGRRKLLGFGAETQIDTRLDKDEILGSPVVLYLDRRARVDVLREGRVLGSAIYEAGNQQIDTSGLPEGSYEIVLRIDEPGRPPRQEERFFSKSRRIPAQGRTDFFAFGGLLMAHPDLWSLAPSRRPYLAGGMSRRLARNWALEGEVQASDRDAYAEIGATWLTPVAQLRAAALADLDGRFGAIVQVGSSGTSRFNFNLDLRHIESRDAGVTGASRQPPVANGGPFPLPDLDRLTASYSQAGGVVSYSLANVRLLGVFSYRDERAQPVSYSIGPSLEWDVLRRGRFTLTLRGDLVATERGASRFAGLSLRMLGGRTSISALGGARASTIAGEIGNGPIGALAGTWQADAGGGELALGAGLEHQPGQDDLVVSSEFRHSRGTLSGDFVRSVIGPANAWQYSLGAQTTIAVGGGSLSVAGKATTDSLIVVRVEGARPDDRFEILVNEQLAGRISGSHPLTLALPPYRAYQVRIRPTGKDLLAYDSSPRAVGLYPGAVTRLDWKVAPVTVRFGRLVGPDGAALAHAAIVGKGVWAETDEQGFFQIEAAEDALFTVTLRDGRAFAINLPSGSPRDGIARLGTIGCCRDTIIRLGALDLAPSTLEKGPQ